jgi:tetratricopeptide (TPR) repeat protein
VRRGWLPALLLLAGCGFYNGYNGIYAANKFASQARSSEEAGRPGEAQNLWGQAAVKAESLLARQPRGKWRNDALAIRGEALSSLGRCSEASVYLHEAAEGMTDRTAREQAALALGRCELELGQPALAATTLQPLAASRDEYRREQANRLRGRALVLTGDYERALQDLVKAGAPVTSPEMLGALAGLDREGEVNAAIGELIAAGDTAMQWEPVLTAIGERNPELGSQVLDRLRAAQLIRPGQLPALLGADAARLSGSARLERLEELARSAPLSDAGDAARLELTRLHMREAATPAELQAFADTLTDIASAGRASQSVAERLALQAGTVARVADSVPPGDPQGDLRIFLAAEVARDSLGADAAALGLFRRVVEQWPDGSYAAKALLAGRGLDPAWAEATDSLLAGRYATSPYVVAARGGDRSAMGELEDSLAAFERIVLGQKAPQARPTRPRPRAPGAAPDPDEARRKREAPSKGRSVEDLQ